MPSPFPGMDPYLESPAHWSDFHAHFVATLANAVNDLLPDAYIAKINEHVMMIAPTVWDEDDETSRYPDVSVLGKRQPADNPDGAAVALTSRTHDLSQPSAVLDNLRFADDYTETYIEILRLPEQQIVTVIELFSPTNKYGEGRGIYMKKRREFLAQPINIVELDLLRAGVRLEFAKPIPANHYHAFLSSAVERPRTRVFSWSVRDRLPIIPIPLRPPDSDLRLDLNAPFSIAYHNGRYRKVVDYQLAPPPPRFAVSDVEWISQLTHSRIE